jgi:hypothetical protein
MPSALGTAAAVQLPPLDVHMFLNQYIKNITSCEIGHIIATPQFVNWHERFFQSTLAPKELGRPNN